MFYETKPEFVYVVVRGKRIWMNEEQFSCMAEYRQERIDDGSRYNTGPLIRDQYADARQPLLRFGEATVWEVAIFSDSIHEMEKLFGKDWNTPLEGETRVNPKWK